MVVHGPVHLYVVAWLFVETPSLPPPIVDTASILCFRCSGIDIVSAPFAKCISVLWLVLAGDCGTKYTKKFQFRFRILKSLEET